MRKLIAHRGNLNGRIPGAENRWQYVLGALHLGYDVEIDVRLNSGGLGLGHDSIIEHVDVGTLAEYSDKLLIHCKDKKSIDFFRNLADQESFHWFCHQDDDFALTNKGWLIAHPSTLKGLAGKKYPSTTNGIMMMPESCVTATGRLDHEQNVAFSDYIKDNHTYFTSVCSDYVERIGRTIAGARG